MTLVLIFVTFFAAFITGGMGYGFSSITVPVALLYVTTRVLNPALVIVEVGINFYAMILNRKYLRGVSKKLIYLLLGIVPAIAIGSSLLRTIDSSMLKIATLVILAPLIILQGFGFRRPIKIERPIGALFGFMTGFLYSLTTISGPPLVILLNNEGYAKNEFKAAMSLIRGLESILTAIVYLYFGFFNFESLEVLKIIIPCALIGVPLGSFVIGKLKSDNFRRVCISLDCWLIAFGLYKILEANHFTTKVLNIIICLTIVLTDAVSAYFHISQRRATTKAPAQILK